MLRALVRTLLLAMFLLACVPPHLLSLAATGRSAWPRRFLRGTAWICGARISVTGDPLRPHSLLIANHLSWLDIPVLGAVTDCIFVSKDELRDQPILRWLADQQSTIYVARARRKATPQQARAIADALHDPRPVAIFPEGTVGPGDRLLEFRSALLAAVTPPPREVDVRPVALDYGEAGPAICWQGESGKDNFIRIMSRRQPIHVAVHLLAPIRHRDDRKKLALEAREAISQVLASSSPAAALYARTS